MTPADPARPHPAYAVLGAVGLAFAILFGGRLAHMLGPEGDHRVAVLDALALLLALVPARGVLLLRPARPLGEHKGWLAGSIFALAWLAPLAFFLKR